MFELTLENNSSSKTILFDIIDNSISQRWAEEILANYPLYEVDRFKGWPNSNKDLNYYINNLNNNISIVNDYSVNKLPIITNILDQANLNYLHKFFEDLRGELSQGTLFYNSAPLHVKDAINSFNILIHECEHLMRDSTQPTIVGTFKDRPRHQLLIEDYSHFTFKWSFGTVYINYCEVGKPLLDVFKDNDVNTDNVRPLRHYSADFMIKFGNDTSEDDYQLRLTKFNEWFNNQSYTFDTNQLSVGLIPVAQLNKEKSGFANYSNIEIINSLSTFNKIKTVCIK